MEPVKQAIPLIAPHQSSTSSMSRSDLPELPVDWIKQPFKNLTGCHLVNIAYQATSELQSTIYGFVNKVTTLESLRHDNFTIIKELNDSVRKLDVVKKQEEELKLMKRVTTLITNIL